MDGSSSAGNPSAASSRSLPAGTNEETPQPADWVSAPEEGDGQSKESQKHQSLAEEPEQLSFSERTNHEDSPTDKDKPNEDQPKPEKAAAEPDQPTKQEPLPTEQQDSLPIDKKPPKDSSPQKQTKPDQNIPGGPNKPNQNESKDQLHHREPPPENVNVTTPEGQKDRQDPPHLNTQQAPHLNIQEAPPPPEDQQNPSSLVLPLKVTLAEVSTLAPPLQAPPLQAPLLTTEVFNDQVRFYPPVSPSGEPKLCGFLLKQGGPLKAWKLRWFMYEDKKNQLFYYRTPQDVMPLGRVELCSATFTYPLKAEKGTFHIKTPERTFILKVGPVRNYLIRFDDTDWRISVTCCLCRARSAAAGDKHFDLVKT